MGFAVMVPVAIYLYPELIGLSHQGTVAELQKDLAESRSDLAALRETLEATRFLLDEKDTALAASRDELAQAEEALREMTARIESLTDREGPIERRDAAGSPGETFRDGPGLPEMVVIPAGWFVMGSPEGEPGKDQDESPQHDVTIPAAFALARTEVTFEQWEACVVDSGCGGYRPEDRGWGRGDRPVINVSWEDARSYIAWLNGKVDGAPYRLPTEAEWEYAARAGTTSTYPWGDTASRAQANYSGIGGTDVWESETAPVASFPANPFGLRDMHGNVWEWTEDCWHGSYRGAPGDGSAWLETDGGDCAGRVVRGGSWNHFPKFLRSADRLRVGPQFRFDLIGFRPARSLVPPG